MATENKCIYFYDKVTKKVINRHIHSQRTPDGTGFETVDCDDAFAQSITGQTGPGEAYEYLLQKVTDNDPSNLDYVLEPFIDVPTSQLTINSSLTTKAIEPKPYLKLSVISPDATFIESRTFGISSSKDYWKFNSDGQKALQLKLEVCKFKDKRCKRNKADKKEKSLNKAVHVVVTHGRLDQKNGRYDLAAGECLIDWVLPDESIHAAQIYVEDTHRNYEQSEHLCSNTINVECT